MNSRVEHVECVEGIGGEMNSRVEHVDHVEGMGKG